MNLSRVHSRLEESLHGLRAETIRFALSNRGVNIDIKRASIVVSDRSLKGAMRDVLARDEKIRRRRQILSAIVTIPARWIVGVFRRMWNR